MATAAQDAIKRLVERRSPEHAANASEWAFLRQSADGGPAYATAANLYRYPVEDQQIYTARLARAADLRFNLSGLVLDAYEGYLFQNPPAPADTLPDAVEAFLESADDKGRSAEALAKSVARWMNAYGIVWVGVDKPPAPEATAGRVLSKQEEADAALAPYAYVVHPTHVLDGKIGHGGAILWLLVQEDVRDDLDPLTSTGAIVTKYRLWQQDAWTLYAPTLGANGEATGAYHEEASGPNPLGVVPFVPFRFLDTDGFASPGLIADIAHIDRNVFNKASQLDEIHLKATFPMLAVPYDGNLYDEDGLTGEGSAILEMGVDKVLPFHKNAGAPSWLEPSTEAAKEIARAIKENVVNALALVLLDGEVGVEGVKLAASGVSKAYTFEKLNKRLATIADTLEEGFKAVFALVCRWQDEDPETLPDVPWDFPDQFEVRSLTAEVADAIALEGMAIPSRTFAAQLAKNIVRKAMPKLDEATLRAIDAEIDAGPESLYDQPAPGEAAGGAAPGGLDESGMAADMAKQDITQTLKGERKTAGVEQSL